MATSDMPALARRSRRMARLRACSRAREAGVSAVSRASSSNSPSEGAGVDELAGAGLLRRPESRSGAGVDDRRPRAVRAEAVLLRAAARRRRPSATGMRCCGTSSSRRCSSRSRGSPRRCGACAQHLAPGGEAALPAATAGLVPGRRRDLLRGGRARSRTTSAERDADLAGLPTGCATTSPSTPPPTRFTSLAAETQELKDALAGDPLLGPHPGRARHA